MLFRRCALLWRLLTLNYSPQEFIGTAIALAASVRTIGGSVGYAIFYNVLVSNAKDNLIPDVSREVSFGHNASLFQLRMTC